MASITFSGTNGIDFNAILDAVMQYESLPLQGLQADKLKVQTKDSAFVSLAAIVSALKNPVTSLTGVTAFTKGAASSSNTSIATVSAGSGANIGQYDISITQLAKGQVTSSTNGYAESTDIAATGGSISFTINGSTTTAIDVTSATTLDDLALQINNQNSGVLASVINDGTNHRLVFTSRNTGAVNGFTINNSLTNSSGAVVAFAAGQSSTSGNAQNAQNALLNVSGIDISSASNSVSGAIPGVAITLLAEGDVSVSVTNDYSSIKNDLNTLVTEYNKLRDFYDQQSKGALGADPVLREVLNDIKAILLTSHSNGGRYTYLSEIGLELTSTGHLKLDQTKLDTALTYSDDLELLFQGPSGSAGVFDTLITTLNSLDGTAGLIKTTRDSIQTSLLKYDDRIDQQQHLLDIRRQALQKMYAAADEAISKLNQLTSAISNLQRNR